MNLELKKAIDQISKDKGLDRDMLIDTLEDAVRTSVLRRFSEDMDVEVTYNDDTGDIEVYQFKIVVEDDDVANEDTQIALADAREHDPSVQLDDEMGFRVKVEDLGRIGGPVRQAGHHPAHARRRAGNHLRGIQGPRGRNRLRHHPAPRQGRLGGQPGPHRGHSAP